MSNYIKIVFQVGDMETREQLLAVLTFNHYEGFEETDEALVAYISEVDFIEPIVEQVATQFNVSFQKFEVPQQNWNALWERNFSPVVVDDFCTIRADFHNG